MASDRFKKVRQFKCPCGYAYDPELGDRDAGWEPGTAFEELPEQLTCPRCRRPKVLFREKRFSVPVP